MVIQTDYDGPELGSTGDVVFDQTMRQAMIVNQANIIDANDDYFTQDLKLAA